MDDEFIDDEEFANFAEGDRRKTKFKGFYINKVHPVCRFFTLLEEKHCLPSIHRNSLSSCKSEDCLPTQAASEAGCFLGNTL